jgi:NAD(P)H dehydrogenase (quinone)
MKIVITGASGELGRKVTALLIAAGRATDLILVSRNPAALAEAAAAGATVRQGDYNDPAGLEQALAGAERMLLISGLAIGRRRVQHRDAIAAAIRAGVKHVVYTSSAGLVPKSPSWAVHDHHATECDLFTSGLAYTILRNSQYAEVIATMLAPMAVEHGAMVMSTGEGRIAFVSKDDCAAAAAAVLTGDGHEGAIYEISGPEFSSFREATALAAEFSGRQVEYRLCSTEEKLAIFDSMGVPRDYVDGMFNEGTGAWCSNEMVTYETAIRDGYFAMCSGHVELLTGRKPKTLREVFAENSAAFARFKP